MLKILWAELDYYKNVILLYVIFIVASFITIWAGVRVEANQVPAQMTIMLVTVFSLGNVQSGFFIKSKRSRMFGLCPIPRGVFADVRFLFPLSVWLGTLVIFLTLSTVLSIFNPEITHPTLNQIFLMNGIILLTESIYLLSVDIPHISKNVILYRLIFFLYGASFAVMLLPFYVLVNFGGWFDSSTALRQWLMETMHSPKAAWTFNIIGYVLYRVSYYVYFKRGDFLE